MPTHYAADTCHRAPHLSWRNFFPFGVALTPVPTVYPLPLRSSCPPTYAYVYTRLISLPEQLRGFKYFVEVQQTPREMHKPETRSLMGVQK